MSIRKKVTILFLISFILMIILTLWIDRVNSEKNIKLLTSRYIMIAKEFLPSIADANDNLLKKKMYELNVDFRNVIKIDQIIVKKEITFGEIMVFESQGMFYLMIIYLDDKYIFYDQELNLFSKQKFITNLLLLIDIVALILIYLAVLKIFSPINELSKKLEKFSKGEFDVKMSESKDKEIKQVSDSFNNMAKSLKESFEDKDSLLKYIGHELKTPLAKVKFALEKDDKELIKESILNMDSLVDEILNMHLLTKENLYLEKFKAETLISEALSKLFIKKEMEIEVICEDFYIVADLNYLSTALKNLIENALKYSTKKPIKIVAKDKKIEVISYGEDLNKSLESYLLPFVKGDRNSKGFGLGLSIVNKIVEKHKFTLSYLHDKGNKNTFCIKFTDNV